MKTMKQLNEEQEQSKATLAFTVRNLDWICGGHFFQPFLITVKGGRVFIPAGLTNKLQKKREEIPEIGEAMDRVEAAGGVFIYEEGLRGFLENLKNSFSASVGTTLEPKEQK